MKKFFNIVWNNLKIIMGLALVVCTFYFSYNYLSEKFRTPDVDYGDSFHNMPKDSVDVVVLGSSHAQYSFIPSFFYQDTGLYSYLLGSSFQPLSVSYQMLREALKTQNPELVILEVFSATNPVDNSNGDYDYRYVLGEYQMTGEEKENTISYISTKEKQDSYRNEFLNNHNNWRTIESIDEIINSRSNEITSLGFVGNWDIYLPVENYWFSAKYDEDVAVSIDEESMAALDNILSLCKENNIELLLYMTPMDNVTVEQQSLRNLVWNWANENNIPYIDFLQRDEELDIRSVIHHDGYHTYVNGASYVTDYLANYVKENYQFESHQDFDELYSVYMGYITGLTIDDLEREVNPNKYLLRLVNYPGLVAISYRGSELNDQMIDYLKSIGIDDVDDNFFALVYKGELIAFDSDSIDYQLEDHKVTVNDDGIYFDGEYVANNDELTLAVFDDTFDRGIAKSIYNTSTGVTWELGYDYYYNFMGDDYKW